MWLLQSRINKHTRDTMAAVNCRLITAGEWLPHTSMLETCQQIYQRHLQQKSISGLLRLHPNTVSSMILAELLITGYTAMTAADLLTPVTAAQHKDHLGSVIDEAKRMLLMYRQREMEDLYVMMEILPPLLELWDSTE